MPTIHPTEAVSLQFMVMRVTKSHIGPGHPGGNSSSSILTFLIDSASLGIGTPLILSAFYLRSIQHPALLSNPIGLLPFTA